MTPYALQETSFDFADVVRLHDLFLRDVLDSVEIGTADEVKAVAKATFLRHTGADHAEPLDDFLRHAVDGQMIKLSLDDIGLSSRLLAALQTYNGHVRRLTLSDSAARTHLMLTVELYSGVERALADLYATVFEGSVAFWEKEVPPNSAPPNSLGGPVNSSHIYTDWGCLAASDAAGVIGTTTMHGWAVMFFGATPVTGWAAAGYLALAGALASFTASQTGICTRVLPRENVPTGPRPQRPDGGGGGRGPIAIANS